MLHALVESLLHIRPAHSVFPDRTAVPPAPDVSQSAQMPQVPAIPRRSSHGGPYGSQTDSCCRSDEPLSALDVPRKRELMQYLESLSKEINVPILYVTHSLDELLRLADRVVLMENGKVKAYDTLENVWNSPLFAPWKGESEQSSVLALPVYLHNPTYKMTALSLGEQQLWINEVHHQANEKVRVCIYSSDVSLTLSKPEQTSIRNILQGQIVQIVPQENRIDIAVLVEGHKVWASISKWAFNELHFAQGMDVYVQIKAISVV
jgi:molybdate transport system ATP-binding protein